MSRKKSGPQTAAEPGGAGSELEQEPVAANRSLPGILIALLAALLFLGDMYVMENGGDLMGDNGSFPESVYYPYAKYAQIPQEDDGSQLGQQAYATYCQVCHQQNGMGQPGQFPPLADSDWVETDGVNRIVRIILSGVSGPFTVNGEAYNAAMPPWRDIITDDAELAALVNYIRNSWGNSAPETDAETVAAIRAETESRGSRPWTEEELLKIPVN